MKRHIISSSHVAIATSLFLSLSMMTQHALSQEAQAVQEQSVEQTALQAAPEEACSVAVCDSCRSDSDCSCEEPCCLFSDEPIFGCLKGVPLDLGCDCLCGTTLSAGGSLRYRHINENNRLRPGGPARSTYDQWRWQNYVEIYNGRSGIHVEMIDASTFNEDMAPLAIDENRADWLQVYADFALVDDDVQPIVLRGGRMFHKYGSQRLVSPLGWSNTYRTFDGLKLMSHGEQWDVDAFISRPVNGATGNINRPTSRDSADQSRTFSGIYSSYHGMKNNVFDFYWLWLREQEPRTLGANAMDGSRHTVGMRWGGSSPVSNCCGDVVRVWGWDMEGAYQFGHDTDLTGVEQTVKAGFLTASVDHTWKTTWSPKVKGLAYWGSGDDDPTDGEINTFSVLFPLGHAYWGLIDNYAGQNLLDYSVQASVKPTDKLTLLTAVHWFNLDTDNDRVYNVAGAPLGAANTGTNLGQELDLLATYAVNKNVTLQGGYFWQWYGDAINNGALRRDDASQFYFLTTIGY